MAEQCLKHTTTRCHFTESSGGSPSCLYNCRRPALSPLIIAWAYSATSFACARGTTMTPSPSATMTSPGSTKTPPQTIGRLTDSISFRPGRMPLPGFLKYRGIFSVMISSVSRAVALVTTPTHPRKHQPIILFEPIKPTSESGASSMTSAVPLRMSGAMRESAMLWAKNVMCCQKNQPHPLLNKLKLQSYQLNYTFL